MTSVSVYHSSFTGEVTPLFNSGIQSLHLLVQIFLSIQTPKKHLTSEERSEIISALFQHVQSATDAFEAAKLKTSKYKELIDGKLEESESLKQKYISDLDDVKVQLKTKDGLINGLNTDIEKSRDKLSYYQEELEFARYNLEEAERERDSYDAIGVASALGLFAVPVVGCVFGFGYLAIGAGMTLSAGILSIVAEEEEKVREAEQRVRRYKSDVFYLENRYNQLHSELSELQAEKRSAEDHLSKVRADIKILRQTQREINKAREDFGKCMHYLSLLSGKMQVLREETLDIYALEPVRNILMDLGKHLQTTPIMLNQNNNEFVYLIQHL